MFTLQEFPFELAFEFDPECKQHSGSLADGRGTLMWTKGDVIHCFMIDVSFAGYVELAYKLTLMHASAAFCRNIAICGRHAWHPTNSFIIAQLACFSRVLQHKLAYQWSLLRALVFGSACSELWFLFTKNFLFTYIHELKLSGLLHHLDLVYFTDACVQQCTVQCTGASCLNSRHQCSLVLCCYFLPRYCAVQWPFSSIWIMH